MDRGELKMGPRYSSFISGNGVFEAAAAALGLGRPAARFLLNDALLCAGLSPDEVTREQMKACMPAVAELVRSILPRELAEERLAGFLQYLARAS